MMNADIKLDGEAVILDGKWTRLQTLDLILDAPSRRRNSKGHRRALVHNSDDGLTINYNADYPAGVTIRGNISVDSIEGKEISSQSVKSQSISSDNIKTDSLEVRSVSIGQLQLAKPHFNGGLAVGHTAANTYLCGNYITIDTANRLDVPGKAVFRDIEAQRLIIAPDRTPENEQDPEYQPYNLFDRNRELQKAIDDLKARVATLESA